MEIGVKRHCSQAADRTCTNASSNHPPSSRRAAVDAFAVHTAADSRVDEIPIDNESKDEKNIEKSEKMMEKSPRQR